MLPAPQADRASQPPGGPRSPGTWVAGGSDPVSHGGGGGGLCTTSQPAPGGGPAPRGPRPERKLRGSRSGFSIRPRRARHHAQRRVPPVLHAVGPNGA